MRVIAGKLRSRPLRSLPGMDVRPTTDRLRETLFNILCAGNTAALEGCTFIDLFAGTGAIGIEAISRGAAQVLLVESSAKAAAVIQENLHELGIASGYRILQTNVLTALKRLQTEALVADVVFLDPPYNLQQAYAETLDALSKSALVGENSLVIAEHDRHFDPGGEFGELRRARKLKQGDAVLSFYRKRGAVGK